MTAYYYNQKEKNKLNARNHTYEMKELYESEISYSIENSHVYDHDSVGILDKANVKSPKVMVEDIDTVSAIIKYGELGDKICALNFASFRNPGGQYINGSMAQEEALCSESYLYNVLRGISQYYVDNKKLLNGGLYSDRLIYSPDILFSRGAHYVKCNIITCAAPNLKYYFDYHASLDDSKYMELLHNRIDLIKSVAEINNNKTIILGAWGCGVFKNNPLSIAHVFKDVFKSTSIDNVVYAVPSNKDGNSNYRVFNTVMQK